MIRFNTYLAVRFPNRSHSYELCQHVLELCPPESQKELRDVMAREWLCTNASGRLPKALQVPDRDLKRVLLYLEQAGEKRPGGVKRGAAILYTMDAAVYVDYTRPDRVSGRYPVKTLQDYKKTLHTKKLERTMDI